MAEVKETPGFKRTAAVALPLWKMVDEASMFVQIEAINLKDNGDGKEMPVATCVDLTTGERGKVILGTVLYSELVETYPDGNWKGRRFEIIQHPKVGKQRYRTYSIYEVDVERTDTKKK